jgi:hypothetical protein
MASTKVTQGTPPNPVDVLAHLVEVANQVKSAKDVDKEAATKGRAVAATATLLEGEWGTKLVALGAVEADVKSMVSDLRSYAELLAPNASELWDQTEVKNGLTYLEAVAPFGVLNESELVTLAEVSEVLSTARKGNGTRAERTPQPVIEGRPNFIVSTYNDASGNEQRLGCNSGNRANSASNIKNAALKFINKNMPTGTSLTQSQVEGLGKAIKNAIETGKATSDLGITFTPSEVAPE